MTSAEVRSPRDRGFTAMIEGIFAAAWFGWGHAVHTSLDVWFTAGAALGVVLAIAGGVVRRRAAHEASALADPAATRRYRMVVVVEFVVAAAGAAVLAVAGVGGYIPAWICAVLAVHFVPLATILRNRLLIPLGGFLGIVAIAAWLIPLRTDVASSTVTALGAGTLLLISGAVALRGVGSTPRAVAPRTT